MNIFYKRATLLVLLIFTFCSILSAVLTFRLRLIFVYITFALLAVALLICLILKFLKQNLFKPFTTVLLCTIFAFLAFLSSHNFFDKKLATIENISEKCEVVAVIRECTFSASYTTTYIANIVSINGDKVNFKASISATPAIYLENGETFRADMTFSPFTMTEYGFDARTSNISNGILVSAIFENAEMLESKNKFSILNFFDGLRNSIEKTVDKNFPSSSSIIKALIIGEKDDIDAMTKTNFMRLGISHILTISGTHFTVLLAMITVLLSIIGINKRIVYALLIPIALFYMGLSGFSFSVCRAGIMSLLSFWGFLCGRPRDSYTALFIAVTVIILAAPYSVFSVSLWLSFTATFTILVIIDLLSTSITNVATWYKKILKYIFIHLLISVSVIFSTLPITAIYFGYISKIAPIANLILVPFFQIFLYILPFSIAFHKISIISKITDAIGSNLLWVVEEFASADNLLIAINQKFVIVTSIIGLAVTIVLLALPLKKKILLPLPSIISVIIISAGLVIFYNERLPETRVSYFTAGVSDSLVITDTNRTACIDISAGTSASMYYTQAIVREHFSTKISAYVFTHYRSNHANTFKKLASRIKITKAYLPKVSDEKSVKYMNEILEVANELGVETVMYDYGTTIMFDETDITVLQPKFLKRSSHEVISVYVSTPKDDLLYLGSSFSDTDLDYSKYIDDAEFIIFGQHYPKGKNRFYFETNANLIYGSNEVYELSDIRSRAKILSSGDKYHFLLK